MAYVKQTWQTGDTVTSAKLNHMEDGIAAAGGGSADAALVVTSTVESGTTTLNKTYAEILAGNYCIVVFPGEDMKTIDFISDIRFDPDTPEYFVLTSAGEVFTCDSPDGYPALTMG